MQFSDAIWWCHNKFKMADGRHIENRLLAIYRCHIGWLMRNSEWRWRITCRYRSRDQNSIFTNSRWWTDAILKITLSLYLSHNLSDFDKIWYADANFHSEDGYLTKNWNFSYSRWWTDAMLKTIYWLYPYWPINAKFGMKMENHMQI